MDRRSGDTVDQAAARLFPDWSILTLTSYGLEIA